MGRPVIGYECESWREVGGHPDYDVSDHGRVRSHKSWRGRPTPRLLTQTRNTHGYPSVTLDLTPGRMVHLLVLGAFMGSRPMACETRHLDGDRTNNRLANLAWGTSAENEADKRRHGTANRGERHPMAKLTTHQVEAIRGALGSQRGIAARFGICQSQVSVIRSGKAWVA